MYRFLISADKSGKGKTVLTMAVTAALLKKGHQPRTFKCGPDYIDPMFHARVLGVPCRNLDTFLMGADTVRAELDRAGSGISILEGAMGLYDGLGGTSAHSAYETARLRQIPVFLVMDAQDFLQPDRGGREIENNTSEPEKYPVDGITALRRMLDQDTDHLIRGILLNRCGGQEFRIIKQLISKVFEQAEMTAQDQNLPGNAGYGSSLRILGYFPELEAACFDSRHLGLITAEEVGDFGKRTDLLAETALRTIDLDRMLELSVCPGLPEKTETAVTGCPEQAVCKDSDPEPDPYRPRIAVARDRAFCFYYHSALERLEQAGAILTYFSPLEDPAIPEDCDALYIGGGYPELYAGRLSANRSMRDSIRKALRAGMPCVAECGGFMYLGQTLKPADPAGSETDALPMVGFLPGSSEKKDRLVRFGYAQVTARKDSMLFRKGQSVPVHEFHYWDSSRNGADLAAVKPVSGRRWELAFTGPSLYAGFAHLYLDPCLAGRFVSAAASFRCKRTWDSLAKPLGSLGRLEDLIIQSAGIYRSCRVTFEKPLLYVVCADNGVIEEGVSQSDHTVTAAVAGALARGASTVSYMARQTGCAVIPVDAGLKEPLSPDQYNLFPGGFKSGAGIYPLCPPAAGLMAGTRNMAKGPAMSEEICRLALQKGRDLALRAKKEGFDVLLTGEMGIGNTTSSAAVISVFLQADPSVTAGRGAGLSEAGLQRKTEVIRNAILLNAPDPADPVQVLASVGGLDLAVLAGIMLGAADCGLPVILDGIASNAAALAAVRIDPDVREVLLPSHLSTEPGSDLIMGDLGLRPVLQAGMRLGEGTGAVCVLGLLKTALAVYNSGHVFADLAMEPYVPQ